MNSHSLTHQTYPKCYSVTIHYFGWFMGWMVVGWLEGSWGGWVCGGMGGWRVHGVGGGDGVGGWRVHGVSWCVVVWVVVGCMVGWVVGWAHGVGAYTHPPIKGYNVNIFNFMNTHPPTHQTYSKCHSVTMHILWRVHGMGSGWWWVVGEFMGWVVGGFMGWVVVGWVVGGFIGWLCVVVWVVVRWVVGGLTGWVHIFTQP